MHQQIMPAGAAPCASRLADMTRDARPAMDAGNNDRRASLPNKSKRAFSGRTSEAETVNLTMLIATINA
jgi:hypothetical protein